MDIYSDDRVVLTLDAGGTNFVFSAFRRGKAISDGIRKDSNGDNLDLCLRTIKDGFREISKETKDAPVAISFAFPGPADYTRGIIGDLTNLPGFRGGVPLKSILEEEFGLPVFINNDGDLFAYGEALGGILPEINAELEAAGSPKRYRNLIGFTLGTGLGGGFVSNGQLITGDNSAAAEIWIFSNRYNENINAENMVSIRAVQKVYAAEAGIPYPNELEPRDIYEIALGEKTGNRVAAQKAYQKTGQALGDTVANLLTFTDGIAVIGGGITGARDLYMPSVMKELNGRFKLSDKEEIPRLVQKVFNLDDEKERKDFFRDYSKTLRIPGTDKTISYDPLPRLGIATSRNGASISISLGAYAFALQNIGS